MTVYFTARRSATAENKNDNRYELNDIDMK